MMTHPWTSSESGVGLMMESENVCKATQKLQTSKRDCDKKEVDWMLTSS